MKSDNAKFPAPVYAETVLAVNFRDAQKYFVDSLFQLHAAHALMLARCGVISVEAAERILNALSSIDRAQLREIGYDGSAEDLFFCLEQQIETLAGDAGKRLHTARSRNDIDITLYRMVLRGRILDIARAHHGLCTAIVTLAGAHLRDVMPGFTHTQPAQPTTVAHYLLGVAECFVRDLTRLEAAFRTVNRSPLGACAITTTGFPIDRDYTAELLAFEGLQENSFGAIAATDYVTETAGAIATAAVNIGKFVQDLLLWTNPALGFLRLPDAWIQISSIMPQKRNPVAIEHVRILASRTLAQAQGVHTCAHNTPFGDIVDSEDDLQPQVFEMTDLAWRTATLLAAVVRDAQLDTVRMRQHANADFLTVTELADTLVRSTDISFHDAHSIVSAAVDRQQGHYSPSGLVALVQEIWSERNGTVLPVLPTILERALDPDHFVNVRKVVGGPAPERTQEALQRIREELQKSAQWIEGKAKLLGSVDERLHRARQTLIG